MLYRWLVTFSNRLEKTVFAYDVQEALMLAREDVSFAYFIMSVTVVFE